MSYSNFHSKYSMYLPGEGFVRFRVSIHFVCFQFQETQSNPWSLYIPNVRVKDFARSNCAHKVRLHIDKFIFAIRQNDIEVQMFKR